MKRETFKRLMRMLREDNRTIYGFRLVSGKEYQIVNPARVKFEDMFEFIYDDGGYDDCNHRTSPQIIAVRIFESYFNMIVDISEIEGILLMTYIKHKEV